MQACVDRLMPVYALKLLNVIRLLQAWMPLSHDQLRFP
eukprot:COSAG01_NODE_3124_length_6550_cov_213.272981_3_plen_38_part_00